MAYWRRAGSQAELRVGMHCEVDKLADCERICMADRDLPRACREIVADWIGE